MFFVSVFLFLSFVVDIFDLLGLLDFLRSITSGETMFNFLILTVFLLGVFSPPRIPVSTRMT